MAKATFPATSQAVLEATKPADADGFVAGDHRNVGSALFQGDVAALRPRATAPATMKVNVAGATVESFFRQVYYNNAQATFAGGDSPAFVAPTTNPRIDLLYLNSAGALAIQQGTEAASPVPPTYPSLSQNLPLCEVSLKVGMTKIVNFEDSGANPAEGYLYRDVRPWVAVGGGVALETVANPQALGTAAPGASGKASDAGHIHPTTGVIAAANERCLVKKSASTSVANGTVTQIGWDQERFDTNNLHDTVTNNHRITIQKAGLYLLFGVVTWAGQSGGTRNVFFRVNDTFNLWQQDLPAPSGLAIWQGISGMYYFNVGDYVSLTVYQDSGASVSIGATNDAGNIYDPQFGVVLVPGSA